MDSTDSKPKPAKRVLKCSMCRRILVECNAQPCEGKRKRKEERERSSARSVDPPPQRRMTSTPLVRGDSTDMDELSAALSGLVINSQTAEPQVYVIQRLQEHMNLVGSEHMCVVTDHTQVDLPGLSSLDEQERLAFSKIRIPVGTLFRVVIKEVQEGRLRIAMARSPSPRLKPAPTVSDTDFKWSFMQQCPYRYLVILDLESTCDYGPEPKVDSRTSEIIEFPWIVYDTQTHEIIDERQIYVMPDNIDGPLPIYSCTKLTGITQEMLAGAGSLKDALEQFDQYMRERFGDSRDAFRIVTDGIWDLGIQLYSEAKRKNIQLQWYMQEYFDIKEELLKCFRIFPSDYRPSLKIMLGVFGLKILGQHHRGIDDCKSISQIVKTLLSYGHGFSEPRHIPTDADYDPFKDPLFVDFGSVTEPGSWKCTTPDCGVWNRPWMYYCRFCDCPQLNQNITSQLLSQAFLSSDDELDDDDFE